MTKRYCKGERFADLSFAGEVFERINLLTWCEKWVYTIPNTRKGAQADETYSRCPAHTTRANALLPDKFPADRLKKQEDAVVWEKCPNIHRHNKRRIDNG